MKLVELCLSTGNYLPTNIEKETKDPQGRVTFIELMLVTIFVDYILFSKITFVTRPGALFDLVRTHREKKHFTML
jgi:hypothetical protein